MRPARINSCERMRAALARQEPDHPPCAFMIFNTLKSRCRSYAEFIERQVALGLDAFVELPPRPPVVVNDIYNLHGLPVSYDRRVEIKEWIERQPGEPCPVMVKEYHTPGGTLRTEVRQTEDWRWGDHVPLFDDYLVPRTKKFLVTRAEDLEGLRYLLVPLNNEDVLAFHSESLPSIRQAKESGLLLAGGWGGAADILAWLAGFENMIFMASDQPDFLHEILNLIGDWNRQRMAFLLEAGIDLYLKRIFYESTDFWSPRSFRNFLLPILKADADLAHAAGAYLGGMITTSTLPLVELLVEAGLDAIIGLDPDVTDLAAIKRKAAGRIALWGGVNGYRTVENGTEAEVRQEVRRALEALAPGGGFILSPVEDVRRPDEHTWSNTLSLIDEWKKCTDG